MNGGRFQVVYGEAALNDLKALPKSVAAQVVRKVVRLEAGLQGNIKRLQHADYGYRLRMGDYRILFDVEGNTTVVQKVGHRKDVYE